MFTIHKRFTLEDERKIIKFVKENEFIYNTDHRQYRDVIIKKRFWNHLALTLNRDARDCQKKWSNMRDYYRKTKKTLSKIDINDDPAAFNLKNCARMKELSFLDGDNADDILSKIINDNDEESNMDKIKFEPPDDEDSADIDNCIDPLINDIYDSDDNMGDDTKTLMETVPNYDQVRSSTIESNHLTSMIPSTSPSPTSYRRVQDKPKYQSLSSTSAKPKVIFLKSICKQRPVQVKPPPTPLQQYFSSVCATVETFPIKDQIQIKMIINNAINERELQLATQGQL